MDCAESVGVHDRPPGVRMNDELGKIAEVDFCDGIYSFDIKTGVVLNL